ncbi:MAG: TonB-dependent receptor [Acidobacteriaceae bacterium]
MKGSKMSRRRQWTSLWHLVAVCLIVVGSRVAFGQAAELQGRVADSSGAVVPDASVTVTNNATGVTVKSKTNGDGQYTVPFLQPGDYTIVVEHAGFVTVRRMGVHLEVDQKAGIDFELKPGGETQTVEVTSEAPLLQTQSASTGETIGTKTIVTMPLNGRDYTQLVTLSAGASKNSYSRAGNGFSLNGSQTFENTMLINGIDNNDYILGADSANINAITPSIDAIQEFKVETSNYSAEYGRSAGGIVSVSIKSGTNAVHGDAFEFLRNTVLDANDFFANRAGKPRTPLHRNQFGGTIGGPILRNHSFFFVGYEGQRQTSDQAGFTTVPIGQEATGNFGSIPIYNPADVVNGQRQEFQSNTIPSRQLDPVGLKLAALYPAPNYPSVANPGAVNNYAYTQGLTSNFDRIDSRFDEQIGSHDSAYVSFNRGTVFTETGSVFAPPGNGNPVGAGQTTGPFTQPIHAYTIMGSETHIFTANLVNEFRLGYTHNDSNQLPLSSQPLFQQFGINGIPPSPGLTGLPFFSITGFSTLGDRTFAPNPKLVQVSQGNDTLSWAKGKHTITMGGEMLFTHNYAGTSDVQRGYLVFTGQFTSQTPGVGTGSALADLLIGQTQSATLSTALQGRLRSTYMGAFVNDSWRVAPKLTLNLGLRYDLQTPMSERDNRMSNFVLDSSSPQYGTLVQAKNGSTVDRTFSNLDTTDFAPRVGISYQATPKTVVRGGFGIFYGGLGFQAIAQAGSANPPYFFSVPVVSATNAATSSLVLQKGFPSGFLNPASVVNPSLYSQARNYPMPAEDEWNVAVEHELPFNSALTVTYVGNSTSHIMGDNDVNAPPPGPGAVAARRPFPGYGEIVYQGDYDHSTYHALQVGFTKRYTGGLSVLSNFTWAHAIDNVHNNEDNVGGGYPQNPNDLQAEKGDSGLDVPLDYTASVIYALPFGASHGWLAVSRLGRQIAGGWQLGGIFTADHGYPLTPSVSPDPANTTTPERPNRTCSGYLSYQQRSISHWFDTACYTVPAPYTYGDSARGVIWAPGVVSLDALIDRTFTFTEHYRLEFRAESFNVANSAHYAAPSVAVGTAQVGTVSNDSAAFPNRQYQFALRLLF